MNVLGVPDLTRLEVLDESSILENLRVRYVGDQIYTNVGNILVAVNPNKQVEILSEPQVEKWRQREKVFL